jgi:putative ABC transport system permease protein
MLVVMVAAVVAIVATLFFVNRSADSDLADKVDEYGANITIVPRSNQLPLAYGGVSVGGLTYDVQPFTLDQVALIRTITNKENINRVAPKLLRAATMDDGTALMVVGVVWDQELPLKKWWQIEGASPADPGQVLLGSRLATQWNKPAGSTLHLEGREFTVAGILQPTGSQDDDILFMDLSTAQELWDRPGEVSFVEVSAWCSTCPIEDISAQIASVLPGGQVSAMRKAMESRELLVGQFRLFSIVVSAFMAAAGVLVVFASTLARVRGRKEEIGVFRALGYRRRHIIEVVVLETLFVGLAGAAVGVFVAWLAAGPVARLVAGVAQPAAPDPLILLGCVLAATVLVVLSGLYPAWVASRLSPLIALRKV